MKKILAFTIVLVLLIGVTSNAKVNKEEVVQTYNSNNMPSKEELKHKLDRGNIILVKGEYLDVNALLDSLNISARVEYNNNYSAVSDNKDSIVIQQEDNVEDISTYRKKRLESFEINKENISNAEEIESLINYGLIAVKLREIKNDEPIYSIYTVSGDYTQEDISKEINEISNDMNLLSAGEDPGNLLDDWSNTEYVRDGESELCFKWKSVGKLYKQTNEVNPTYDYYYVKVTDYIWSGDYQENNGYEINDLVLNHQVYNATNVSVLNYGPTDQEVEDTLSGNINLMTGEVGIDWSISTGTSIDIITDTDSNEVVWGLFPHNNLWLPSAFTSDTVIEFKVAQSDDSFYVKGWFDATIEKNLVVNATYTSYNRVDR